MLSKNGPTESASGSESAEEATAIEAIGIE